MSILKCDKCGNFVCSHEEFCSNCGERTPVPAYCVCGKELDSSRKFCPRCGRPKDPSTPKPSWFRRFMAGS